MECDRPLSFSTKQLDLLKASAALLDVSQREKYLKAVCHRVAAIAPISPSNAALRASISLILSTQFGIAAGRELLHRSKEQT